MNPSICYACVMYDQYNMYIESGISMDKGCALSLVNNIVSTIYNMHCYECRCYISSVYLEKALNTSHAISVIQKQEDTDTFQINSFIVAIFSQNIPGYKKKMLMSILRTILPALNGVFLVTS